MNRLQSLLTALLRAVLTGESEIPQIPQDSLDQLYTLADRHDLAHLVSVALWQSGQMPADPKLADQFRQVQLAAVYRSEKQAHGRREISQIFETASIPFIPLKGTVLQNDWPEPWMRTSCDIDILIHKEDLEKAVEQLTAFGYQYGGRTSHDVSFSAPNGVHIELHHNTVEDNYANNANAVLSHIWEHVSASEGSHCYLLDDAMFYFYHIAHMAKHFENGGCGMRPFLDLWLLNHKRNYDSAKRRQLLEEVGFSKFERAAVHLSEVWLSGAEPDELTEPMTEYIIHGGAYGTMDNMVAVGQQRKGGSRKYLLSRLLVPYERLKEVYPVLERHKWLLPVMELRRIGHMVLDGRLNRAMHELRLNRSVSKDERRTAADLIEKLGL